MPRVVIIAEAGVNHNGDLGVAKKMVEVAASIGADFVKFQTFSSERLVSKQAGLAEYQNRNTNDAENNQLSMLKKLELKASDFKELQVHCKHHGIGFLSTPFDLESIDVLEALEMPFWKVPSGAITDLPYLEKLATTGRPLVISTGMSTMQEIGEACLAVRKVANVEIALLHCNSEYPTPYEDVNLGAMATIRETFNVPVGYSDHTPGIEVAIAAVALGATVLEKHFTLDKTMVGPDHVASLDPLEMATMVRCVRNIEVAIGSNQKYVTISEQKNVSVVRKSIVAKRKISLGEVFTIENITTKRPGTGVSPMAWHSVLGSKATREYQEDDLIER